MTDHATTATHAADTAKPLPITNSISTTARIGTVVQRARAAAQQARNVDPEAAHRPPDYRRAARRRDVAYPFACNFGIDPSEVIVTDDPHRTYGEWRGFLITVTDAEYPLRFMPIPGYEVFLALGPCPDCGGEVPLAETSDLAALGLHLDTEGDAETPPRHRPPEFFHDPGHTAECRAATTSPSRIT